MKPLEDTAYVTTGTRRSVVVWLARLLAPVLVLAIAAFFALKLMANKPEAQQRQPRERSYVVRTADVHLSNEQTRIAVFGEVRSARTVDLRVPVSGKIIRINPQARIGAFVARGTELVEIDRFTYEGELRDTQAGLAEARARLIEAQAQIKLESAALENTTKQLTLAINDLDRARALRKSGTVTNKYVEERDLIVLQRRSARQRSQDTIAVLQARLDQARLAIERAEWRLERARRNLSDTILIAPFDGVIRSRNADIGRIANTNDVIVSLYDPHDLEARFILSDQQYGRTIAQGSPLGRDVRIIWRIGDEPITFEGVIARIGADVKSGEGGIELFARVTDTRDLPLRPGAFVEVALPGPVYENVARLPESAVYNGDHLFAIEDNRLVRRGVTVVGYDGSDILVRGEIASGDRVMITRIAEAGPGLKVEFEDGG